MKEKILIVEDQFIEANNLQEMLENEGYSVLGIARSVKSALSQIEKSTPDWVLLDIYLKGELTGIDLAYSLRNMGIPFVYLSANSDRQTLEAAKATNPFGFLVKPFREKDVLVMLEIAKATHQNRSELKRLETPRNINAQKPNIGATVFGQIIGKSEQLVNLLKKVQLVASTDTTVLILGESGTGKERIAESIHELSDRKNKPLIKVNCSALPSNLVESILFGHEKGAFTDANEKRIGKFELANDSTIFLDEIGEMPLDLQSKLLRVLQEREIERIGNNFPQKINVRVIAATNRNLQQEVAAGRFRMDLYYRLNVFPLEVPALRDRRDDIPILTEHFIQLNREKHRKPILGITNSCQTKLNTYHWPGNIRELEHVIERNILLCKGSFLDHLEEFPRLSENRPTPL